VALVPHHVASLQPYVPGKPIEEVEREYGVADVAKLASNENALGPSPLALRAAREACSRIHLYPDGSAWALKRALSARFSVPVEEILVGNGSNELIELIVRTFVLEGEEVLTSARSFVAYKLAAHAHGRTLVEAPMKERFHYDLDAIRARLNPRTKVVFLANPDNPTGTWFLEGELVRFLGRCPRTRWWVLDEAYVEFVEAEGSRTRSPCASASRTWSCCGPSRRSTGSPGCVWDTPSPGPSSRPTSTACGRRSTSIWSPRRPASPRSTTRSTCS